jgi:rare lipoprotein A
MRTELNLRIITFVNVGACLGALTIALPTAVAAADDATPAPSPGGFGYDDSTGPSVFADGATLLAPLGNLLGDVVQVHGTLPGARPGDGVVVQYLDDAGGWQPAATATVGDDDGAFDATWKPAHSGRTKLRAVPAGQAATATTAGAADLPARDVTVFRRARATWYGPGFYGRRTACGTRLSKRTLGVAHKTLPCGTLVELFKDGRTVTVPVIDRGPFRPGTSYDLTYATAQAIGMTGTSVVGAVRAQP